MKFKAKRLYSRDMKFEIRQHSKFSLFDDWISNGPVLEGLGDKDLAIAMEL